MSEILKSSTCKSLSGDSTLTYSIGHDKTQGMIIRIMGNSGPGLFCKDWVSIEEIERLLSNCRKPFSSRVLSSVYKGRSANSSGFLMAALLEEGSVIQVTGKGNSFMLGRSLRDMEEGVDEEVSGNIPVDLGWVGEK